MGCLYLLTSPSGKSYVGITSKTLEKRWAKHVEHALGKRDAGALYGALRKYGVDGFKREVLAESNDWAELCRMEIAEIARRATMAPGGYNLTIGGEGIVGPLSPDAIKKISVAQKRRYQRPEERAKLAANAKLGREKRRLNRLANPPPPKPPRPLMSPEERSARTRAGMAEPKIREKVLACAKQRAASPEWRVKISATKTGKKIAPCSEHRRAAIAETRRREWADPVIRAMRLAAMAAARAARGNATAGRTPVLQSEPR